MTIIDAITSSPLNVFFTIFIGLGLAYLYLRKPPSSSSSTSAYRTPPGIETGVVDEELQRAIAQIERQERDMIRQEQDEAYQKSLEADREKKLRREQEAREKEAREREEREKTQQSQLLHQRLTKLKSEIRDTISSNKTPSNDPAATVKLVFKLPDGTRVKRDFIKTDKVKMLYWFVFSLDNAPLQFRMTTNFPKRDLPGRPPLPEDFHKETIPSVEPNCELTLEEAKLTETQILFVYDMEA